MSSRVRTIRCPECGGVVFETASECKHCQHPIVASDARRLADYEDDVAHAFHAGSVANITANTGFGMYGASLIVFILFMRYSHRPGEPVSQETMQTITLGVSTLFAFVLLPILVIVPIQVRSWRKRFAGLADGHPELESAKNLTKNARYKWIALAIIWFHINLIPALLLLGLSLGLIRSG